MTSDDGGGPLTVPVWYTYRPGGTVNVSTGRDTRKARAIAAAGRFGHPGMASELEARLADLEEQG